MKYKNISAEELNIILERHLKWLKSEDGGERANLRYADLSSADLRSANLRSADLSSADLRSANLRSADLSSADLSYADLSSADLSYANLSSANLRYADLRYADLSYADLSYADLRSADLRSADLRSADLRSADLLVFQFNRHTGYFTFDGQIRLGCHNLKISDWITQYKTIGAKNEYSKLEIAVYGNFIKLCSKLQERHNRKKTIEKPKEKQLEVTA